MLKADSSEIHIKKIHDDEAELLKDLNAITFDDGSYVPDFDDGIWWIAYYSGRAIGFAGLLPETSVSGYLQRVGILKSYRGHRLQRRFIFAREREARRIGLKKLYSDTMKENYASINNLAACGYKMFKPQQPWSGPDQLYWKKEL